MTAVGELYVDGIGIGMDVVARDVGLEKWTLHPVSAIACLLGGGYGGKDLKVSLLMSF